MCLSIIADYKSLRANIEIWFLINHTALDNVLVGPYMKLPYWKIGQLATYIWVLFDRHEQFFLQVDDGSDRLWQLQGGFVHKAIHCVAVHVFTDSVNLWKTQTRSW